MKIFLLIFFLINISCTAQDFSGKDIEIFNQKINFANENNLSAKPINDVIVAIGKSFLGTEYKGFVLEKAGEESLVVNLRELDCTTFLENVLAISRCVKKSKTKFSDFLDELRTIRYRNEIINQYPSRLHYFTDWIYDNEAKGIVKDITKKINGTDLKLQLDFMSTHSESYMHLKENPDFIPVIAKQEKEISNREYFYIPTSLVGQAVAEIKNGDLIAFTSGIKGLDVNHVGIAIKQADNRIHILHAPEPGTKVQITELALPDYIKKIKHDTGIIVFRAINP